MARKGKGGISDSVSKAAGFMVMGGGEEHSTGER